VRDVGHVLHAPHRVGDRCERDDRAHVVAEDLLQPTDAGVVVGSTRPHQSTENRVEAVMERSRRLADRLPLVVEDTDKGLDHPFGVRALLLGKKRQLAPQRAADLRHQVGGIRKLRQAGTAARLGILRQRPELVHHPGHGAQGDVADEPGRDARQSHRRIFELSQESISRINEERVWASRKE